MAQPNVVREPSMDEILASIRRIIESNEPVTQAGIATAMAQPEGFSGQPANDDAEEVTLTVDDTFADHHHEDDTAGVSPAALRAVAEAETEMRTPAFASVPHQATPMQAVQPPQKSLSLADVAARVRAASERSISMREEAPAVQPPVALRPVVAAAPVMGPAPAHGSDMATRPVEDIAPEPAHDFAEGHGREDEHATRAEMPSLLSSSAGEQVARSFQDLAIAVDHAERRSFDEIAEEMLRPMLQEWLDDNLPTLVERLVREEIERVARGPRR